jgi:hypothetical protein
MAFRVGESLRRIGLQHHPTGAPVTRRLEIGDPAKLPATPCQRKESSPPRDSGVQTPAESARVSLTATSASRCNNVSGALDIA